MPRKIVTEELVIEIANKMISEGKEPSILDIQSSIGGGSYTTVKKYLDLWKQSLPKRRLNAIELPDIAVERLMSLGRDFWSMIDEQSSKQVEILKESTQAHIGIIQSKLNEAEKAIIVLEDEKEALEKILDQKNTLIESLEKESVDLKIENARLEGESQALKNQIDQLLKMQSESKKISEDSTINYEQAREFILKQPELKWSKNSIKERLRIGWDKASAFYEQLIAEGVLIKEGNVATVRKD
jgi:Plasmid replication region DNA-binding N-term